MVNTYDNIFVAEWLTFHISRCRNSTTNTPRYRILASRTQMDLNHHQFVLPLNYVCIQWVEILPQPFRRKNYAYTLGITYGGRCMPAEWQSLKKAIRWYDGLPLCILALEESVRFELTEHYCSSVFKTDALNQTLPTFHVVPPVGLEPTKPEF